MSNKVIKSQYLIKAEPHMIEVSAGNYYVDGAFLARDNVLLPDLHGLYEGTEHGEGRGETKDDKSLTLEGRETARRIEEEIIAEAKRRAEEILSEAKEEAERLREEAREEGLRAGMEEGRSRAIEEAKPLLSVLREAARLLQKKREELLDNAEKDLLDLALGIIRKLLGEGSMVAEDTIVKNIRKALARAREKRKVVIRVNEADLGRALGEKDELKALFDEMEEVEIVSDAGISRGGCVVETGAGFIDARLETQMKAIEDHLRNGEEL